MASPAAARNETEQTLTLTRVFDAPADVVFKAWVDPAQMARWLGPQSVKAEVTAMDPRPGGVYRVTMYGTSNGATVVNGRLVGTYREVKTAERLVFTWAWEDEAGKPKHETIVTVTFRAKGRQTELTLHQATFEAGDSRDKHNHGWAGSFDNLAALLAGRPVR
jgi:uncharacterized protein YndB with AHSA1/START domain